MNNEELRFYSMAADSDIPGHPSGMYGVVDEEAGGIIAWAVSWDQADALAQLLNRLAGAAVTA